MKFHFLNEQFNKNKKQFIVAAGAVVFLLAVYGIYSVRSGMDRTYYAVFLSNNQVYFGNLSDKNDRYVTLKNASYLQSNDPKNPGQVQLVRRGLELHLPTGSMRINRDNILFIEELSGSSPVSKNIEEYKKSQ